MSVFLAWLPDEDARRTIADILDVAKAALATGGARHRWRRPDQWHMTLRHLGDQVAPSMRARIDAHMADIVRAVPPHQAGADGLDAWRGANVLVLRTALPPPLAELFEGIEAAMRACGFRAEAKSKQPHVTLAYLDSHAWPDAAALPGLSAAPPPFRVDRVCLLENPGTGRYRTLAEWPLSGNGRVAQSSLF